MRPMRRGLEVAGLPVVQLDSGRVVGRVKEAVFDLARGRLEGLRVVVDRVEVFLAFDQVYSLGENSVTVGAEVAFAPASQMGGSGRSPTAGPQPAGAGRPGARPGGAVGKRVLDAEGRVLGFVDDVLFDPESGAVWGYEVSAGFISDFVEGRKSVPLTEELVVGPDSILLPQEEPAPIQAPSGDAPEPPGGEPELPDGGPELPGDGPELPGDEPAASGDEGGEGR